MHATRLPIKTLDRLRCWQCQAYLSCGPTKILHNGYGMCGRCVGPTVFNSIPFDNIARYFIFPCKYKNRNCPDSFVWNEVASHESVCSYRPGCMFCCRHPCSYGKSTERYNGEPITLIATDDMLENYLTCVVCNGYLITSPVFLTTKGTSVCHRCGPIINDFELRRNIPLETLLEIFVLRCSFRIRDCNVYLPFGAQLVQHESICEHQHIVRKPVQKPRPARNPGDPPRKERGLVPTHRGHVWATLTPNTLYGNNSSVQQEFLKDLRGYKVQGDERSSIRSRSSPSPDDVSIISDRSYGDDKYLAVDTFDNSNPMAGRPQRDLNRSESSRIRHQVERNLSNRVARNQIREYNNVLEELHVKQKHN